ncbi:MAG: hypothetical protein LAP85_13945 [Acidobacteriia bacterium]|nr:hypothetical protein [Terriglobia bacterium]
MTSSPMKLVKILLAPILAAALVVPASLRASEHVVSKADIQKSILAHAQERQGNLSRVRRFFTSDQAARALENFPGVRRQIERAVSHLDDQELARLAARVDKAQRDFAAGALTNQQLTYIIIALATAVIVLIIVKR